MGENGMPGPHDLLHLDADEVDHLTRTAPRWVKEALAAAPYVVVRRENAPPGKLAVGVRGSSRAERFASFLDAREGRVGITPESLAKAGAWRKAPHRERVPVLEALERVDAYLSASGWAWGPCGSVGFELATGRPAATAASDLDIVVRCAQRLGRRYAGEMMGALDRCGSGIDVILETPGGGVSLRDLAFSPGEVLLRTSCGAKLVADPWDVAVPATVSS